MEEQEKNEEQGISKEDGLLVIEIFKKALEYRPQIPKAIIGEEYKALSEKERLNEMLTRRVAYHFFDKLPCLFFRFVGDETPVVEAFFYPIEAIYSFLSETRSFVRLASSLKRTDEEKEKLAVERAIAMTLIMIDSFYQRAELMMDSFISEVIREWHRQDLKNMLHFYAERGDILPYQKDTSLENAIKDHAREVLEFWKYQGQTYENWQKIRFAEEYEIISTHWKWLSKMSRENINWREYAKAGKFQDTPDDLLDKLENTDRLDNNTVENKVSELALEHAARRVRLIKRRGVSESIIKQRKEGVRATGYTSTQLFSFLKEGRELVKQYKAAQEALTQKKAPAALEQDGDSTQIKKVKSLEQKMKFIQGNVKEPVEQNGDSTQEENG